MKNKSNYIIDLAIFAAFLAVMAPRMTGIAVHEWLSLALAGTVIAHIVLHFDWIVNVGGQYFKKLFHSSRLKFVVDLLLFVAVIAVMLSGILISRSILPLLGLEPLHGGAWKAIHSLSANLSVLLLGLHLGLNWSWIRKMSRRYLLDPLSRLVHSNPQPAVVPVVIDDELHSNRS